MIRASVTAWKARMVAQGLKVHTEPPTAPEALPATAFPYVVLYPDAAPGDATRLVADVDAATLAAQTTCVGLTAEQVNWARERLTAALEGWRPTVAGRSHNAVEHSSSQPTRPDFDLPDRVLFIGTDQWRSRSHRA
jgi:hypothetical protein